MKVSEQINLENTQVVSSEQTNKLSTNKYKKEKTK